MESITLEFNNEETEVLKFLLDFVIPSSSSCSLPSASFLFEKTIKGKDFLLFHEAIKAIIEMAKIEYPEGFGSLNIDKKNTVIQHFKNKTKRNFNEIIFKIITDYYTSEKVLSVVSSQSVPPFPNGNFVKEGDLLLFEDVFLKGDICRKCPTT